MSNTNLDEVILIDDDMYLARAWSLVARKFGSRLYHFNTFEQFMSQWDCFNHSIPIFLDVHFENTPSNLNVMGLELSKRGFQTIYICTGYKADLLIQYPWAAGIVDKMPPWLR